MSEGPPLRMADLLKDIPSLQQAVTTELPAKPLPTDITTRLDRNIPFDKEEGLKFDPGIVKKPEYEMLEVLGYNRVNTGSTIIDYVYVPGERTSLGRVILPDETLSGKTETRIEIARRSAKPANFVDTNQIKAPDHVPPDWNKDKENTRTKEKELVGVK